MIQCMHDLLFIRHKQYRDICWRVLAVYGGTGHIKYKAECWNMGYNASWPLSMKDYIEIKNEDLGDWLCTTDIRACLRYAHWRELKP